MVQPAAVHLQRHTVHYSKAMSKQLECKSNTSGARRRRGRRRGGGGGGVTLLSRDLVIYRLLISVADVFFVFFSP